MLEGPDPALLLDGRALGIDEVESVARGGRPVELAPVARERLTSSRSALEQAIAGGEVLYGVNTGFGSLAQQRIDGAELRQIQKNLVLSHAAGVGEPLPDDA